MECPLRKREDGKERGKVGWLVVLISGKEAKQPKFQKLKTTAVQCTRFFFKSREQMAFS